MAQGRNTEPLNALTSVGVDPEVTAKLLEDGHPQTREELVQKVASAFSFAGPLLNGNSRQVVALIGPTGVGKPPPSPRWPLLPAWTKKRRLRL
jgi:flagellar biosynthesis GTPase FlhF